MPRYTKKDFPVCNVRRFLEPGPIVLVSSAHDDQTNIMTMGWHMVMEFSPSLISCLISSGNHSFELIRKSRHAYPLTLHRRVLRQLRMHALGCRLGEQVQRVRIGGGEGACRDIAQSTQDDPLSGRWRVHDLGRGDAEVSKVVQATDVVKAAWCGMRYACNAIVVARRRPWHHKR